MKILKINNPEIKMYRKQGCKARSPLTEFCSRNFAADRLSFANSLIKRSIYLLFMAVGSLANAQDTLPINFLNSASLQKSFNSVV